MNLTFADDDENNDDDVDHLLTKAVAASYSYMALEVLTVITIKYSVIWDGTTFVLVVRSHV